MRGVFGLLFVVLVPGLAAQPIETARGPGSPCRLVRLDYDNSSGEKGTTYFAYGEKGLVDRALWELADGSRYSVNSYEYDGRNNLVRKSRKFSDNKDTVQVYRYDERDRLRSEEFFAGDASKGVTTYEYDDRGRLVLIHCRALNGWIDGTIRLAYDGHGRRTKAELVQDGEVAAEIVYSHDRDGNLRRESWSFKSGWRQTLLYAYEPAAGPGASGPAFCPFPLPKKG